MLKLQRKDLNDKVSHYREQFKLPAEHKLNYLLIIKMLRFKVIVLSFMKKVSLFILIVFFIGVKILEAQITTTNFTPNNTAVNLVNNVLLGNGVQAFNIQVYGAPNQYGYFSNGANSIGLDSGIVLSTNDIVEIPLPAGFGTTIPIGANSGNWGPTNMGTSTNNDLLSIANLVPPLINQTFSVSSANDACIIEFDFIPTSDTIEFQYVFASDEYNTFINSNYNDVFAFLLSGPGITGPYTSPPGYTGGSKNLAIVPGSVPPLPISISSLQPALNAAYHVTNLPTNLNTSMNGFTTVLTVKEKVTPCDTFHIRLAIADGSDHSLGSAVFLNANSFKSKGVSVVAVPTYNSVGGDSILFEGCGGVNLTFTRQSNIAFLDTVILNISGNAINGVDYSYVSDTLFFQSGQDSLQVAFTVFNDSLIEGVESIFLEVINTTACFSNGNDTLELQIFDPLPISTVITNDTTVNCTVDSLIMIINGSGLKPITHVWTQSNDTTTEKQTGQLQTNTNTFYIYSYDACGINSTYDTITITEFTPSFSSNALADTISCLTDSVLIGVEIVNGYPELDYVWNNGIIDSAIWVKSSVDSSFIVTVSLGCSGQFEIDTFTLLVQNAPFSIAMKDDSTNCTVDSIQLGPQLNSAIHGFSYLWGNGKTDSSIWVSPYQNTQYKVTVTDACGLVSKSIASMIYSYNPPLVVTTNSPTFNCIGDTVELKASAIGGFPGYRYVWDNGFIGSSQKIVPPSTRKYAVLVTDTCRIDTVLGWVYVTYKNHPPLQIQNIVNPFLNCPGDTVTIGPALVVGGSGDNNVSWNQWINTVDSMVVSIDSTAQFIVKAKDHCNLDSTQRIVTVGIQKHNPMQLNISEKTSICAEQPLSLFAEAKEGAGNYKYNWSTGSTDTSILVQPNYTTAYGVTITDDCGNQLHDNVRIRVLQPVADFSYSYIDGREIRFSNSSSTETVAFLWNFGNGDTSTLKEPVYSYPLPFEYTVKLLVKNSIGCRDSTELEIVEPLQVFIPNSFSPNGDGLNDEFALKLQGVSAFVFRIFDRWGNLVFETNEPNFNWQGYFNGEPLKQDVYVFNLQAEGYNRQVVKKMGSIMLMRK